MTWPGEELGWQRLRHQRDAGRYGLLLVFLAIAVFVFGIAFGVGGEGTADSDLGRRFGPDAPRWAGMAMGLLCALFFPMAVRACRGAFEALGLPPERVERGVGGMLGLAGVVMILCGLGGLLYAVSPVGPAGHVWDLRIEPLGHAREMALASGLYAVAGLLMAVRGLRGLRGLRQGAGW